MFLTTGILFLQYCPDDCLMCVRFGSTQFFLGRKVAEKQRRESRFVLRDSMDRALQKE